MSSHETQDEAFMRSMTRLYNYGQKKGYFKGKSQIQIAGMLKAGHIGGYGGMTAVAQGQDGAKDSNGTSSGKYYKDLVNNGDGIGQATFNINDSSELSQSVISKANRLDDLLSQMDNESNTEHLQKLQEQITQLQEQLSQQQTSQAQQSEQTNQAKQEAIEEVFSRASIWSDEDIEQMTFLSDEQKQALRQLITVKEQIKGENTQEVNNQMVNGVITDLTNPLANNLGTKQYNERFIDGIENGDLKQVINDFTWLDRWVTNHTNKSQALQQAFDEFEQTGKPITIAPTKHQQWIQVPQGTHAHELTVDSGSVNLIEDINIEADALTEFKSAWQTALSARFPSVDFTDIQNIKRSATGIKATIPAHIQPVTNNSSTPTQQSISANATTPTQTAPKQIIKIDKSDGVYTSMSNAQEYPADNLSWLANPYHVSKGTDVETYNNQTQKMGKQPYVTPVQLKENVQHNYVQDFTDKFLTDDDFAHAVMNLKGKSFTGDNYNIGTTKYLQSLLQDMPDDLQQAREYVDSFVYDFKNKQLVKKTDVIKEADTQRRTANTTKSKPKKSIKSNIDDIDTDTVVPSDDEFDPSIYDQTDNTDVADIDTILDEINHVPTPSKSKQKQDTSDIDNIVHEINNSQDKPEPKQSNKKEDIDKDNKANNEEKHQETTSASSNQAEPLYEVITSALKETTNPSDKINLALIDGLLPYLPQMFVEFTNQGEHGFDGKTFVLGSQDDNVEFVAKQLILMSIENINANEELLNQIQAVQESMTQALNTNLLTEQEKLVVLTLLDLPDVELLQSVVDKSVRDILIKIPMTQTANKAVSVFKRIADILMQYFGIKDNNAYMELLNTINEHILNTDNKTEFESTQEAKIINDKVDIDVFKRHKIQFNYTGKRPKNISIKDLTLQANKKYLDVLVGIFNKIPHKAGNYDKALTAVNRLLDKAQKQDFVLESATENKLKEMVSDIYLAGLSIESVRNPDVYQRDLLKDSFIQLNTTPLAKINNLLPKLRQDLNAGLSAIAKEMPNAIQIKQIKHFLEFDEKFKEYILQAYDKPSNDNYRYKDLKSFIPLTDNVLSAISLSVYQWLIEYGNHTSNNQDDIVKLFGLNPQDFNNIPDEFYDIYAHVGNQYNFMVNNIGKGICDSLGLKLKDNAINGELDRRLHASLGDWALVALINTGMVHQLEIPMADHIYNLDVLQDTVDEDLDYEETYKGVVKFVSVTDFDGNQHDDAVKEIAKTNKGTLGYLGKLLTSDVGLRYPKLQAPTQSNKIISRADVVMHDKQRELWDKVQQQSFRVNPMVYQVFTGLFNKHSDAFLQMIGAKITNKELQNTHILKRESKQATADGKLREFERMVDFVSGLTVADEEYQPFWDNIDGTINGRSQYVSNVVNIQSNKIQRAVIELSNSQSVFNKSDNVIDDKGKLTVHGRFFQALAEKAEGTEDIIEKLLDDDPKTKGLYTRGFTFDKIQAKHFVPAFMQYLQNDESVQQAVSAMTVALDDPNKVTDEHMSAITTLVKQWDMGAESLRALIEYTHYVNADDKVTTYITYGSDGVNNGSMIGYSLTGTLNQKNMTAFGLLNADSGFDSFQETRTDANKLDYYEGYSPYFKNIKQKYQDDDRVQAIYALAKSLSARSALKAILIPFGYGGGSKKLKQASFRKTLDDFYTVIENVYKGKVDYQEAQSNFKKLFNTNKSVLPAKDKLLDFTFSKKQLDYLQEVYQHFIADEAVEDGLQDYAHDFIKVRDLNVGLHGLSYELYADFREQFFAKKEQQKKDELRPYIAKWVKQKYPNLSQDELKTRIDKQVDNTFKLVGFSKSELELFEKQLQFIKPRLQTAWTFDGKDIFKYHDSGIDLYAIETKDISDGSVVSLTKDTNQKTQHHKLPIKKRQIMEIGVKANALQTQSIDGMIAAKATSSKDIALNIHDALNASLENFKQSTQAQNQATFDAIINYHQQTANLAVVIRTLKAYTQHQPLHSEQIKHLLKDFNHHDIAKQIHASKKDGMDTEQIFANALHQAIDVGIQADINKLEQFKKIDTLHQYGGEDGQIQLGKQDKKVINEQIKLLKSIKKQLHQEVADVLGKHKPYQPSARVYELPQGKLPKHIHDKVQQRADDSNKYIGFGSGKVNEYRVAFGDTANTGQYSKDDTVMVAIDANPDNPYRIKVNNKLYKQELNLAIKAGATLLTAPKRMREYIKPNALPNELPYNIGEIELAEYLQRKGYAETDGNGVWKPIQHEQNQQGHLTQIKVSDDVVHAVPTHFVDKVVQPKLDDLKQISSGKLLPQNRQALESILDYLHSINPFVSFGFVKDNLEAVITKSDIASKNYFVSHISGNTLNNDVSINLNTPSTDTDLFETVVHEYVHTITNKLDLNDFFGLEQVQDYVANYVQQNNIIKPRRLDYFLGVNASPDKKVNEVLTIGLTNPDVASLLQAIWYGNMSVYQHLSNVLSNVIHWTIQYGYYPQEYNNDFTFQNSKRDDTTRNPRVSEVSGNGNRRTEAVGHTTPQDDSGTTEQSTQTSSTGNQEVSTSNIHQSKPNQSELNIWFGSNENAPLSNLALRPFTAKNGRLYQSVEHFYQSHKTGKFNQEIYNNPAWFKAGTKIVQGKPKTNDNFNIKLMKAGIKMSFEQNPDVLNILLATGNQILTHHQDKGIWKTKFPELLMEVRDELRSSLPIEEKAIQDVSDNTNHQHPLGTISSITQVVDELSANDDAKNVFYSLVELLDKFNPQLSFEFVSMPNDGGRYFPVDNVIRLSAENFNKDAKYDDTKLKVINHEIYHALTETGIAKGGKAVDELKAMYQTLKDKAKQRLSDKDHKTWFANINEFVSYGMTEQKLAEFINEHLSDVNKQRTKSGFKAFVSKVLKVFGFKADKRHQNYKAFVDTVIKVMEHYDNDVVVGHWLNQDTNHRPSKFNSSVADTLKSLSTQVSDTFNQRLDALIDTIVGVYDVINPDKLTTSSDDIDALQQAHIAKQAGFELDDKQAHTFEMLYTIAHDYIKQLGGSTAMSELYRIAHELDTLTKTQLSPTQHDYLFGEHEDFLQRMIALSLTDEKLSDVLNTPRQDAQAQNTTWFDTFMSWVNKAYRFVLGKINHTDNYGTYDTQIQQLVLRLVAINQNLHDNKIPYVDRAWQMALIPQQALSTQLKKLISSMGDVLSNANALPKAGIGLASLANMAFNAPQQGRKLIELSTQYDYPNQRLGHIREVLNEFSTTTDAQKNLEHMARLSKRVETLRAQLNATTQHNLKQAFTRELSEDESHALTRVLLRTDMSSLLNRLDFEELVSLLGDTDKRQRQITKLEQRIAKQTSGIDMVRQTKRLGWYLATEQTVEHLVKNAKAIASRTGLPNSIDINQADANLVQDIDVLASLYAYEYSLEQDKQHLNELLKTQQQGLKLLLDTHLVYTQASQEDFAHNPYNYQKGYLPQITSPYKSVKAVHVDDVDSYLEQGYQVHHEHLPQDKHDDTQPRVLMVHDSINTADYVSGAVDMADTHAKGFVVHDYHDDVAIGKIIKQKLHHRLAHTTKGYKNFDPSKEAHAMVIRYDSQGAVMDYHYEMQRSIRDELLERDNDVFANMGMFVGKHSYLSLVKDQQRQVAHALYQEFKTGYAKSPRSYVLLSPNNPDPKVREQWAMLPYAFKQEAQKLYGKGNPIAVKNDIYNMSFGFRSYSIREAFSTYSKDNNFVEKAIASIFKHLFQDNAQIYALKSQNFIQEMMKYVKDFIVIRNVSTLMGNTLANMYMLMLYGIPPVKMVKGMIQAIRLGKEYDSLYQKYLSTNELVKAGKHELKPKLNRLKQQLSHHKMHQYMSKGLKSTIVEDTIILNTDHTYESAFEEAISQYTKYIPDVIKQGFKLLTLHPDTQAYQFLAQATQYSDFTAKYVLAEHLQEQGNSLDDAVSQAQETFINFDVPTSRGLDYANKMGLFMFTKFFIRFQKVLQKQIKDNPVQVAIQSLLLHYGLDLPTVVEPAWLLNIDPIPVDGSLLIAPNALMDITPIDLATRVL